MQLEAHSDSWSHHLLKQVQVSENPLIFGCNTEVPFKQGVETIQEGLQASARTTQGEKIVFLIL